MVQSGSQSNPVPAKLKVILLSNVPRLFLAPKDYKASILYDPDSHLSVDRNNHHNVTPSAAIPALTGYVWTVP